MSADFEKFQAGSGTLTSYSHGVRIGVIVERWVVTIPWLAILPCMSPPPVRSVFHPEDVPADTLEKNAHLQAGHGERRPEYYLKRWLMDAYENTWRKSRCWASHS